MDTRLRGYDRLEKSLKYIQVQRLNAAHPHGVFGMVFEVITCIGMNKHRQTLAVQHQPRNHSMKCVIGYVI